MTEDDTFDLLERIAARWPNFRIPQNMEIAVDEYMQDLEAFDYDVVLEAVRSFRGEKFAPTLSEVMEKISPAPMGEPWMTRPLSDNA